MVVGCFFIFFCLDLLFDTIIWMWYSLYGINDVCNSSINFSEHIMIILNP